MVLHCNSILNLSTSQYLLTDRAGLSKDPEILTIMPSFLKGNWNPFAVLCSGDALPLSPCAAIDMVTNSKFQISLLLLSGLGSKFVVVLTEHWLTWYFSFFPLKYVIFLWWWLLLLSSKKYYHTKRSRTHYLHETVCSSSEFTESTCISKDCLCK